MRRPSFLRVLLFVLAVSFSWSSWGAPPDARQGEKLFKQNCSACHKLGARLVGPDLLGVTERRDAEWLIKFIQNSQALVKSGDKTATALFEKFNKVVMPPQPLNEDQIRDILAYIESGGSASSAAAAGGTASSGEAPAVDVSLSPLQWIIIFTLLTIILVLVGRAIEWAYRSRGKTFHWEKASPYLWVLWGIAWALFIGWQLVNYTKDLRITTGSVEGAEIDFLMKINIYTTLVIYFIVHVFLFYFLFRYRHREGKRAYYYAHNNKLEVFWTTATAIPLVIMIIYSMTVWQRIMGDPGKADEEVEVFAYQFGWKFRYPGPDGKLGKFNYRLIDPVNNPLGLDFDDPAAQDDIIVDELYLAKGKKFKFHLRSRDVIHDAWFVHFNMQLYAQPGMRNSLMFTPQITTDEARKMRGKPDFNFELACNQICGAGHFNMQRNIYVLPETEYRAWLAKQTAFYQTVKDKLQSTKTAAAQ